MLLRAVVVLNILAFSVLSFGQKQPSTQNSKDPLAAMTQIQAAASKAAQPIPAVPPIIEMCDMGEIRFDSYSLPEADRKACEAANKFVALACNVTQYMPLAQQAMAGLSNNPGDPKKACESAEKLNQIALAMNAGFGTTCGVKAALCIKACNIKDTSYKTQIEAQAEEYRNHARLYYNARPDSGALKYECLSSISRAERKALAEYAALSEKVYEKRSNCQMLQGAAGTAIVGGFQSFAGMQHAKDCQKFYSAASCNTMEDLRNKPSCKPVLCDCVSGLYKGYAECSDYKCNMDCTKAENLDQIECICQANPSDPLCANYNGGMPPNIVGGDNNNNGEGTVDAFGKGADGGFPDGQLKSFLAEDGMSEDFLKDKKNGNLGANGQPMQPGAPLNAGGGYQGNPGAGGGRGGPGKGPYNTDILGGAPGANGAAFSGAGGGYFGSEGANQNPKNSINLRDFLPGGKGAQRALAGKLELEKNGVTDSNGLSNWQKITRQMNELRRRQQLLDKAP